LAAKKPTNSSKPTKIGGTVPHWRTGRKKKPKVTVRHADGRVEVKRAGAFAREVRARVPRPGAPPADLSQREQLAWYRAQPYWKMIRQQALERDGHRCRACGARGRLDVHHLTYARVGKEDLDDLLTLCRSCHEAEHERRRALKREAAATKKARR
jgi:hypothetical protein